MGKNKSIFAETFDFIKNRKAWWLTPIIIMLLVVSVLIIIGEGSTASIFIYALW